MKVIPLPGRSAGTREHGRNVVAPPQVPITRPEVWPTVGVKVIPGCVVELVIVHVNHGGPDPVTFTTVPVPPPPPADPNGISPNVYGTGIDGGPPPLICTS